MAVVLTLAIGGVMLTHHYFGRGGDVASVFACAGVLTLWYKTTKKEKRAEQVKAALFTVSLLTMKAIIVVGGYYIKTWWGNWALTGYIAVMSLISVGVLYAYARSKDPNACKIVYHPSNQLVFWPFIVLSFLAAWAFHDNSHTQAWGWAWALTGIVAFRNHRNHVTLTKAGLISLALLGMLLWMDYETQRLGIWQKVKGLSEYVVMTFSTSFLIACGIYRLIILVWNSVWDSLFNYIEMSGDGTLTAMIDGKPYNPRPDNTVIVQERFLGMPLTSLILGLGCDAVLKFAVGGGRESHEVKMPGIFGGYARVSKLIHLMSQHGKPSEQKGDASTSSHNGQPTGTGSAKPVTAE